MTNRKCSSSALMHAGLARVLNDVFPLHIAEKLRKGEKVEPEHHDEVKTASKSTILFALIDHAR